MYHFKTCFRRSWVQNSTKLWRLKLLFCPDPHKNRLRVLQTRTLHKMVGLQTRLTECIKPVLFCYCRMLFSCKSALFTIILAAFSGLQKGIIEACLCCELKRSLSYLPPYLRSSFVASRNGKIRKKERGSKTEKEKIKGNKCEGKSTFSYASHPLTKKRKFSIRFWLN